MITLDTTAPMTVRQHLTITTIARARRVPLEDYCLSRLRVRLESLTEEGAGRLIEMLKKEGRGRNEAIMLRL